MQIVVLKMCWRLKSIFGNAIIKIVIVFHFRKKRSLNVFIVVEVRRGR